jgi:hypothetical protein
MTKYIGPNTIFYCPENFEDRDARHWWPWKTGTISVTYQFPFWLTRDSWVIEYPDYKRLHADRVLSRRCAGDQRRRRARDRMEPPPQSQQGADRL